MRKINLIVLHCSATRETMEYTPEQLERDHKARGFFSAGYNYYIRRSGEVVPMRPPEQIPAHVRGYNAFSLGICYEGGLDMAGRPKDTRTLAQRASLLGLLRELRKIFPKTSIVGHNDLNPMKECPCFNCTEEYRELDGII